MWSFKFHNPFHLLYLMYLILLLPANSFSQEYTISYTVQDIYSCDIDLDNDQDLVICSANDGTTPDTLYIFYNDGIGNLTKSALNRLNRIFVRCGNIDDDQYPDIITKDGYNILFIKNNGNETFGEEKILAPSQSYRVVEYIEDMNGDNMNDLVYAYNNMYTKWGILKNEGGLIFSDHIVFDGGIGGNIYPKIGMLNSDNMPDGCLAFTQTGTHVLINNGDLTFDTTILCSTMALSQICKLNIVPPDDIALFSINTGELFLYENLGNAQFTNKDTLPLRGPVILTDVADFNNDGYDDYCYALCWWTGCTDSIYISINDQNWSFIAPQMYYVGQMQLFRTVSTDLNGDDFNDIIMYGYSPRNAFKILWNDGFGNFSYENPVGINEKLFPANKLNIEISPNPFNSSSKIILKSNISSEYKILFYDLNGKPVQEIFTGIIKRDQTWEFNWYGKNSSGQPVPKGLYIMTVSDFQGYNQTNKIIKY